MSKLSMLGFMMLVIPIIASFVLMLFAMAISGMGKELMIAGGIIAWVGIAMYLMHK